MDDHADAPRRAKTWRSGPPSQSPGAEVLAHLYLEEKASYKEIARRYGVTATTVMRWLRAAGISARSISEATKIGMSRSGYVPTEEHKEKLRANVKKAQAAVTPESQAKAGRSRRGREPWNKGKSWSDSERASHMAVRATPEYRAKLSAAQSGEKSWNWKGGVRPEHLRSMDRAEWRRLRQVVYERDNWTCQDCGCHCVNSRDARTQPTRKVQAHHIVPRRLGGTDELSNLITLCMSCHHKRERRWEGAMIR